VGNVCVGQFFKFVKSTGEVMFRSFFEPTLLVRGINKDPTIWLDRARPPPKYVSRYNINLTNSKIRPTLTLQSMQVLGATKVVRTNLT
jgi:hypothetical protein